MIGNQRFSLKIRRTAFGPLAFFTFRKVLELAVFKQGLHFNLAPAGTEEFLGGAGRTGVFTGLSHGYTPCQKWRFYKGFLIKPKTDTFPGYYRHPGLSTVWAR
jgi:hypothetical protein